MKLLAEIGKDAKLFYREGRTITLLFIVPVLILLILSAVFGKATGDPKLNIRIGFCDLDKTNFSEEFIAGIETSKIVDLSAEGGCGELAMLMVSSGKISAAVVIPQGFESGIKSGRLQNITLFLDNTRIQTSPSIEGFFKASADSSSKKISIEYVSAIWTKLLDADKKLSELKADIENTRNRAKDVNARLQDTRQKLESIDFDVMTSALEEANSTISGSESALQGAKDNLTEIEKRFNDYDQELLQSESDLTNISLTVNSAAFTANSLAMQFNCTPSSNASVCGTINNINTSIGNAKIGIGDRLVKIKTARADINTTNTTVQHFKERVNASLSGVSLAQKKINELSLFAAQLKNNQQQALATLRDSQAAAAQLLEKTGEMEALMDVAKQQVREITSREPQAVVSPITLDSVSLFEKKTFFEFLLPGLVPIILMFLSLFLSSTSMVREKIAGTLERLFLSQLSSIEYSVIKIISYAVVLFPQLLILLLTSSLLYGAFSVFNIDALFYLIAVGMLLMAAFNALGFMIAAFADSEATAFLASLVIGLPLLFMSGLLFPFDFMPSFMARLGELSPLSQGITAMQSVINYSLPNLDILSNLAIYVLILNVAAVFVIKIKMRG